MTSRDLWLVVRRLIQRSGWRSVGFVLLIAGPLAVGVGFIAASTSVATTDAQRVQVITGGHDIEVSIGGRPFPADLKSLLDAHGVVAGTRLDVSRIPVNGSTVGNDAYYTEANWQHMATDQLYRFTVGTLPQHAREVALSTVTAKHLGVHDGDTVTLGLDSEHPLRITGVFVPLRATESSVVIAGLGTWSALRLPALVRGSVFPSRAVLFDEVGGGQAQLRAGVEATMARVDSFPENDPFYVQRPLLVALPFLLLLVVAAAGAFSLTLRSIRADLVALAALGCPGRALLAILAGVIGTTGAAAAALGILVGSLLKNTFTGWLGSILQREAPAGPVLPLTAVAELAMVVIVTTMMSLLAMSGVVLRGIDRGDGNRPSSDAVPPSPRGLRTRRGTQIAAAGAVVASLMLLSDGLAGAVVVLGAAMLLLAVSARDLLDGVAVLARVVRMRLTALGAVLATRDGLRSIAIAAVVMVGVCLPVGLWTSAQSLSDYEYAGRTPNVPVGQIRLNTHGQVLDAVQIAALSRVAGGEVAATSCVTRARVHGCWSVALPGGEESADVLVVKDPRVLRTVLAYEPAVRDIQALERGQLVLFGAVARGGKVALYDANGHRATTVPAVVAASGIPAGTESIGGAVMLGKTAEALRLKPAVQDYRVLAPVRVVDSMRDTASALGMLRSDVTIDEPQRAVLTGFAYAAVVGGAGLAVLCAFSALFLGVAGRRRTANQLGTLGMPALSIKFVGGFSVALPLVIGIGLGGAVGLLIAWLRLARASIPVVIPTPPVVAGLIAMVVLTAAAVAAGPKPRLDQLRHQGE